MEKGETSEGLVVETAVDAGRRNAMCKIAVSVGVLATYSVLPDSWTRPIIGQIVVPVHAATSGSSLHDPCSVEQRSGDQKSETIVIKVTGYVTPPVGDLPVVIVATAVGGANQRVEGQTKTYPDGTFEAYLTVGGGPGITSIGVTTTVTGADGSANCSVNVTTGSSTGLPTGSFSGNMSITSTDWSVVHPEKEYTTDDLLFCVNLESSSLQFYDQVQGEWVTLTLDSSGRQFYTSWDNHNGNGYIKFTIVEASNERIRVRFEYYGHDDYSGEDENSYERWWEGQGEGWLVRTESGCASPT